MSNSTDYRSTLSTSVSKSIITSSGNYQYTTSYTTSTTSSTTQSSSIIGIHSQPYRNYLTERNHFYHSASQPTTFTTTTSSLRPSTIISSIQTTNQQPVSTREQYQQQSQTTVPKHQQSLFSSLGIHKFKNSGSKQSLNSQTEANQNNNKMAANNKHRTSNSSLALDGGYVGKTSSMDNIDDDDDYDLYHQSACSKFLYGLLWLLAQGGLFGAVAALVYWFFKYDKGFAYQNDKRKMYNLHAFLMLSGFIFVNGQCKCAFPFLLSF